MKNSMNNVVSEKNLNSNVSGEFVTLNNERYYAVRNVDSMAPFFISIISPDDHWLFASSTGGLTAGRVSPETALFPYITVDRIHESGNHTGPKTIIRLETDNGLVYWEPFNIECYTLYDIQRNLYRSTLGNKICFEEINKTLGLVFKYTWETSETYGFSRTCELINQNSESKSLQVLDGLQNLLPSGTPRFTQTNSSNLVDAYKWTELDSSTGLAMFTLYSGITDRAEPCESLNVNTTFVLGAENPKILLSSEQVGHFRRGGNVEQEDYRRGIRGAYLVHQDIELAGEASTTWQTITDIDLTQSDAVKLLHEIKEGSAALQQRIADSIDDGSDRLARIMASADGFQATGEENVAEHHYANVLYNVLRGGIFDQQYTVTKHDLLKTISMFNSAVFAKNAQFLNELPETLEFVELVRLVAHQQDKQLQRLVQEYLPITFGRRHGDPSRPWNQFAINLKDEDGNSLLSYQGNWRDIFQNWEALAYSYPEFAEAMIAKFVNASTMDGYNPYRITKEGIDWEVEEPDDPWSYIGYWGDHQIIYLQKLLEVSQKFGPDKLGELLYQDIFCYANVPYKIKTFEELVSNAKDTVYYDEALAQQIEHRVADMGSDGKMVCAGNEVYQVNLVEKLLVPLLTKLSNLVLDGGIWLNTQRPEWNDANNALVGQGLSMVTLYYMRRYIAFLTDLLESKSQAFSLSAEVATWLDATNQTLADVAPALNGEQVSDEYRFEVLSALGKAACDYRATVYQNGGFSGKTEKQMDDVILLLRNALTAVDHCIATNRADDGLYHAYNLIEFNGESCSVAYLYPMLEGQVSALSTGNIDFDVACDVLEKLFDSDVYRHDIDTFMLYPDRAQTPFLQKNTISESDANSIPLLALMIANNDTRIVVKDKSNVVRFNSAITNAGELVARLKAIDTVDDAQLAACKSLYEKVFNHKSFTGRSGGMFGFEGLGCVYWHMVSKLLLAVAENFERAVYSGAEQQHLQRLGKLYYRVRSGIGFNKTPGQYGAIPTDPYSHTPKHAGAQQPGMTGQVKEEVISRFIELGVKVEGGCASFNPVLIRPQEFSKEAFSFKYLDVNEQWQSLPLAANSLGFTWCQVPVVYEIADAETPVLTVHYDDGSQHQAENLKLSQTDSEHLFKRDGRIKSIKLSLSGESLFQG
ncbi:hypothetical protein [Planctobacterium marinum]|uniref:Uncharacterized protein n=1 Tax=Planctobacterium marinum TaxID=1631968 RepID=A0AA48HHR2_9ALTE|nr:hypothetical protein MACH26_26690 [Planctobacterium marinum]